MTTDEQGRTEPPEAADERDTLVGFLEFHRATFALKTGGLDDADLLRESLDGSTGERPPPAVLTLGSQTKRHPGGGVYATMTPGVPHGTMPRWPSSKPRSR